MSMSQVKIRKILFVRVFTVLMSFYALNDLAAVAEEGSRKITADTKTSQPHTGYRTVSERLLVASGITNVQEIVDCAIGTHAESRDVLRRASIRALIGRDLSDEQKQAVESLRPLLTNRSECVRSDVIALYISLGETNLLQELRGLSVSAERSLVRIYAVDALADVGDFSCWQYLRERIEAGDAYDLQAALPVAAKYLRGDAVPDSDRNVFVRAATRGKSSVGVAGSELRTTYFRVVSLLESIETDSAEIILASLLSLAANESESALVRDALTRRRGERN